MNGNFKVYQIIISFLLGGLAMFFTAAQFLPYPWLMDKPFIMERLSRHEEQLLNVSKRLDKIDAQMERGFSSMEVQLRQHETRSAEMLKDILRNR